MAAHASGLCGHEVRERRPVLRYPAGLAATGVAADSRPASATVSADSVHRCYIQEAVLPREGDMQISERQPGEVREIAETRDRVDLSRAAHKIAWARMNGSIDVANPFVEANSNRAASERMVGTTGPQNQ